MYHCYTTEYQCITSPHPSALPGDATVQSTFSGKPHQNGRWQTNIRSTAGVLQHLCENEIASSYSKLVSAIVLFLTSGGARSRNLGGNLRGNTHFWGGGQDRILRNLPSPSLPKFLTPWIFFHTFFPKFFPGHF